MSEDSAWLGFALAPKGDRQHIYAVRICAWHDPEDKALAEHEARAKGFAVTHGICETCSQRLMAAVLGEAFPSGGTDGQTHDASPAFGSGPGVSAMARQGSLFSPP